MEVEIIIEAVLVAVSNMRGLLVIDHVHVAELEKSWLRWVPHLRNRGRSWGF